MIYALPMIFVLIGLALYGILGGADFGAGFWQLTAGQGAGADRVRAHAHDSMAPVWEANHVWLIFVLTVTWTGYPAAFGSIASTLSLALAVAGLGIIARGAAYALRTGTAVRREQRAIDTVFGISSLITPFALGAAIGGIASGRVPVGNAAGDLFSSWLNPTSILVGVLAVLTGAYLAAVFLSADAVRRHEPELTEAFRRRALGAGLAAGAVALGGLVVLHDDAHSLFHGLVAGDGLPALIVSTLTGGATIGLVWIKRFEPARYTASIAVAAIVAGWALAQNPQLLPGLSVRQAAASYDTQVALVVAILVGASLLGPSLATLFRLALGGRLGEGAPPVATGPGGEQHAPARPQRLARFAVAFAVAGIGLMNVATADWAHGVGAICYLGFIGCGFRLALPLSAASDL